MTFIKWLIEFLRPNFLGTAASVIGIANGLNGLMGGGGSSSSGGGPPMYVPKGLKSADQQWQDMMAALSKQATGISGAISPQLWQSYMAEMGINPSGMLAAGQGAGNAYGTAAGMDQNFASILGGQGRDSLAHGDAMWNAGADPQHALHDRMQGQVVDASRAATSARGIGMSPYAAGAEADAVGNFNMDWQNQQLQRMLEGGRGSGMAGQMAGADFSGASGFAGQVPGNLLQAGQVPYGMQQQVAGFPAQYAMQYGQNMQQGVMGPEFQVQGQDVPYMNYGQGAQQGAFNAFAENRNFGANQQQGAMAGLMYGLNGLNQSYNTPGSWLNKTFDGGWGGGGGGDWSESMAYGPGSRDQGGNNIYGVNF